MAKERKRVHVRRGRTSGKKSPGLFELETNQRILAAYALARNSHLWQFHQGLGIDETSEGLRLWKGIHNGVFKLADRIYPRVLIELRRGGLLAQKKSDHCVKSESLEQSTEICFAWFHSLIGRALEESWRLAPWYQFGSAIGKFLVAVLGNLVKLPSGGLGGLIKAARLLTAEGNCRIPELNTMVASSANLAGQGNLAFLHNVLGWDYEPDPKDMSREPMILYGMVSELDARVEQGLLQDTGVKLPRITEGGSLFPWHDMDEEPPRAFKHGPLSGTAKQLARWILLKDKDPRQLRHFADKAIWFQRQHRTLFHAYFHDLTLYEQELKRKQADHEATQSPVKSN